MTKMIKKVQLNSEQGDTTQINAYKGTSSSPYQQSEFERLILEETWSGGYVEGMGYVVPMVTSTGLIGIWDLASNLYHYVLNYVSDLVNAVGSGFWNSIFSQTVNEYNAETPENIIVDINSLGLRNLTLNMLLNGKSLVVNEHYSINLSLPLTFTKLAWGLSAYEFGNLLGVACTIGTVTFVYQGAYQFKLSKDKYDFDLQHQMTVNVFLRNIGTVLGKIVNEAIATSQDISSISNISADSVAGVLIKAYKRQHRGPIYIEFTGTITIK